MGVTHPPTIPDDLLLRPPGREWDPLLHPRTDEPARTIRRELGLPVDRPIVMSGHQPTIWHPGILAKWLAIVHAAGRHAWHPAWLGVDHDAVRPLALRWPVVRGDVLGVAELDLAGANLGADVPACALPPGAPAPLPARSPPPALQCVGDGLVGIHSALAAHADARSSAEQALLATRDLIHPALLPKEASPSVLLASHLHETTLFREIVQQMRADPTACAAAYNQAIAGVPGIRPLDTGGDTELPLWRLAGLTRRSVHASDLHAPALRLAPKALLLTLLLRLGACDLFVHGTGAGGLHEGEGYDRAADAWARQWLGHSLAPIATASATLRLPLGTGAIVTHAEAARAAWRAWHARHDPAMLELADLDQRRRQLVAAIRASPRRSRARAESFAALQGVLVEARDRGRERLAELDAHARHAARRAGEDVVRADRTWPFPLYPPEMLRQLSDRVAREFAPLHPEGKP